MAVSYLEPTKNISCGCGWNVLMRVNAEGYYEPVSNKDFWPHYSMPICEECVKKNG